LICGLRRRGAEQRQCGNFPLNFLLNFLGIAIIPGARLRCTAWNLASLKIVAPARNLAETVRDLAEDAREMPAEFDVGGTVRRFQI